MVRIQGRKLWLRVLVAVGVMLLVAGGLWFPFYPVVAFEAENSGRVLAYFPVDDGTMFHIEYIHSIHLSPVVETYSVRDGQIVQEQITFEEYGVGMPANAEGHEEFIEEDGRFVLRGMERAFWQVDLRVARVTESQKVLLNGDTIAFTSFAKPGAWIRMKVRNINGWRLLKGGSVFDAS